jgi:hypothetical protein
MSGFEMLCSVAPQRTAAAQTGGADPPLKPGLTHRPSRSRDPPHHSWPAARCRRGVAGAVPRANGALGGWAAETDERPEFAEARSVLESPF